MKHFANDWEGANFDHRLAVQGLKVHTFWGLFHRHLTRGSAPGPAGGYTLTSPSWAHALH